MMRMTSLVAVAGFLTATGFGVWAAAPINAPVRHPGIEPFKLMTAAKNLPTDEFIDYTVVFN